MTLQTANHQPVLKTAPRQTMNILILDDSEADRHAIMRLCDKAGLHSTATQSDTLKTFSQALDNKSYDLIFIDYLLGPNTGLEALDIVMKHPDQATAASIMIAGEGQIDIAIDAMRRGCADYLMKSMLTVESLQKSVATAIERQAVMAQFAQADENRRALEASVRRYADASNSEMRQLLAATLRRVRLMRRHKAGPDYIRDLSTLEIDIDKLWEALPSFKDQVTKEMATRYPIKAIH